jgi:2-dehydropantoate 2-reductase
MTPVYRRVCVVGPGAIGGMLAVLLERAGLEVSALARPARARRIAAHGITLLKDGNTVTARPRVASDAAELGPQDLVAITVKSNNLREIAGQLAPLCGRATPLVFLMNGVPWWFFDGFPGPYIGSGLVSVDPDVNLSRTIPIARVVWGMIEIGARELPDGTVKHDAATRIVLGRPDNTTAGLDEIAVPFHAAGYTVELTTRIRESIWLKLQMNAALNPVSALALATGTEMMSDPFVRDVVFAIMEETRAVGRALGFNLGPEQIERLREMGPSVGGFKTSMLQDIERGRPLELDALVAVTVEIAGMTGVDVPFTKAVLGLLRSRAKAMAAST